MENSLINKSSFLEFLAAMTVMNCERTWKFFKSAQLTSVLIIAITDTDCPRLPVNEAIMVSD